MNLKINSIPKKNDDFQNIIAKNKGRNLQISFYHSERAFVEGKVELDDYKSIFGNFYKCNDVQFHSNQILSITVCK